MARNQARQPVRTCALKPLQAASPAVTPVLSLRRGDGSEPAPPVPPRVPTVAEKGAECRLTQLAGGPVAAGGADAGTGDRVALLGGSGTLADLSAALAEGPRQAGWRERGHPGGSGLLGRSYPTPVQGFPPFLFEARI